MPLEPFVLATLAETLTNLVMVLFIVCSFLLSIVILMQEGKGGGLSGAFGGAGTETFGVKAGAVNKFTAWLAAAFLGLALLHAGLSTAEPVVTAPETIEDPGDESVKGKNEAGDPAKNAKDAPAKDDQAGGNGDDKPKDK